MNSCRSMIDQYTVLLQSNSVENSASNVYQILCFAFIRSYTYEYLKESCICLSLSSVERNENNSFIYIKILYMIILWYPSDHILNSVDDNPQKIIFMPQRSLISFDFTAVCLCDPFCMFYLVINPKYQWYTPFIHIEPTLTHETHKII